MKNTTKTPAKKAKVAVAKKSTKYVAITDAHAQTMQDVKTATLITSGLANMFVLIGWVVLQTTSQYNQEVVSILFR